MSPQMHIQIMSYIRHRNSPGPLLLSIWKVRRKRLGGEVGWFKTISLTVEEVLLAVEYENWACVVWDWYIHGLAC